MNMPQRNVQLTALPTRRTPDLSGFEFLPPPLHLNAGEGGSHVGRVGFGLYIPGAW